MRSLQNIAQKINKYATKHEINTMKAYSDNFTNLPSHFFSRKRYRKYGKIRNVFQCFVEFFSLTMREPGRLT